MNSADEAQRHARVKEVFLAISELPPAEWTAALARECAGDALLQKEVESLLAHHRPESLLDTPTPRSVPRIAQITFDRGATAKWNEEQRSFLHQRERLLAVLLNLTVATAALRIFGFFGVGTRMPTSPIVGLFCGWGVLFIASLLLFVLRAPRTVTLRRLELMTMLGAATVVFSWSYGWLVSGRMLMEPPPKALTDLFRNAVWVTSPGRITHFQIGGSLISVQVANQWGILAGLYGFLIPNHWRRNAVMLASLLVGAASVIIIAAFANSALRPIAVENLLSCLLIVSVFGGLGFYICQRFQALRRAVFDAQQVGQYRLIRQLGKGAMGEVYLAQHRLLRRPCAIKLIRPEQAGSQDWLLRFEREVQAMAQLTHPNTVEVYDFGRTEDDSFFYAMEYLPGKTLDALLRAHGPLPAGRVIYFLRQLCGALAEAHDKGLVHRDIKPGNIIVCERGGELDVIKLLDFGLVHMQSEEVARAAQSVEVKKFVALSNKGKDSLAEKSRLTLVGQLLGTPAYMSPEQVRGLPPDTRSDLYSLGGVACYLLTGKPPFERETLEDLFAAHLHAEAPKLRDRVPAVPEALELIVARCLEKDPRARFQHIREMEAALSTLEAAADWDRNKAEAWWREHGMASESAEALKPVPQTENADTELDVLAHTMKSI